MSLINRMNFINQTMHPEAGELYATLIAEYKNEDSTYPALKAWQVANNLTEEQAAELYAFVIDCFGGRRANSMPQSEATSLLSRALWLTERAIH